jgi:hypothetical protein
MHPTGARFFASRRFLAAMPAALALTLLVGAGLPRHAAAQDTIPARPDAVSAPTDTLRQVRLTDGSRLIGRVVSQDGERVVIETAAGARVEVRRSQIASMEPLRGEVHDGEVWQEDPHATRLFLGPTARSLRPGEGYVGDFELFVPFVAYGVTDRVTIGASTVVAPEVTGRFFAITPKVEVIRTPRASFAVGAAAVFATEELDAGTLGIGYGVGTFGSRDASVTIGAGLPFYASREGSDVVNTPVGMLGGEMRVGAHTKLLTENYFVSDAGALLSGGVRLFGERLSVDAGLMTAVGANGGGWVFPLLNFVYSFGGPKR